MPMCETALTPGRARYTERMIALGWMLLGVELFFSALSGFIFWHFWSHSAMTRGVAVRAITIYLLGCLACIMLTFFIPL